jgi:hypothetical protein
MGSRQDGNGACSSVGDSTVTPGTIDGFRIGGRIDRSIPFLREPSERNDREDACDDALSPGLNDIDETSCMLALLLNIPPEARPDPEADPEFDDGTS